MGQSRSLAAAHQSVIRCNQQMRAKRGSDFICKAATLMLGAERSVYQTYPRPSRPVNYTLDKWCRSASPIVGYFTLLPAHCKSAPQLVHMQHCSKQGGTRNKVMDSCLLSIEGEEPSQQQNEQEGNFQTLLGKTAQGVKAMKGIARSIFHSLMTI